MPDLYPLKFEPYFKEVIWGGRRLETFFRKRLPPDKPIGESWEIFDTNIIKNGPLTNLSLADTMCRFGQQLLGTRVDQGSRFPLLLKLSTTELNLSIQVHPDDAKARDLEPDNDFSGKTEMIYVLDAMPGARVFYGFSRQVDLNSLQTRLIGGTDIVELLQEVVVKPEDVIFVPPGTVHGYGAGLVYFELQQNSDITYRLFDWNRVDSAGKPRQLHIAKALDVIDYAAVNIPKTRQICVEEDYGQRCFLTACRHFLVERLDLFTDYYSVSHSGDSFHILCVVDGSAILRSGAGVENELRVGLGDVVLIPAAIIDYLLIPDPTCQILRSYVPELEHDVIDYLRKRGIPIQSILNLGGGVSAKNDLLPLLPPSETSSGLKSSHLACA